MLLTDLRGCLMVHCPLRAVGQREQEVDAASVNYDDFLGAESIVPCGAAVAIEFYSKREFDEWCTVLVAKKCKVLGFVFSHVAFDCGQGPVSVSPVFYWTWVFLEEASNNV